MTSVGARAPGASHDRRRAGADHPAPDPADVPDPRHEGCPRGALAGRGLGRGLAAGYRPVAPGRAEPQPAGLSVSPADAIQQLQDQQALLTQALRAMLEGNWCGAPPSVQAFVSALDPSLSPTCVPPYRQSDE